MLRFLFGGKNKPLKDTAIYTVNFVERFQGKAEDGTWKYDLRYKTWWVAQKIGNTDQYRLAKKSSRMPGSPIVQASKIPADIRQKFNQFTVYTTSEPVTSRDGRKMMSKEEALRELEYLEQHANTCDTIHDIATEQAAAKYHFSKFMKEMGLQPITAGKPATDSTSPNTPLRLKGQGQHVK
jgi:hypothetical protein